MTEISECLKICRICAGEQSRSEFHKNPRNKDGLDSRCKTCRSANPQKQSPEQRARYRARYMERHGPARREADRRRKLQKRWGLTYEERLELRARQGGGCAICGDPQPDKELATDHNHATGAIRGLLCKECNMGLGKFKDDVGLLRVAIEYLERDASWGSF